MVAIDGASGSGKSTFADELAATLEIWGNQVVRASIDSFHRPRRERYRLGAGSPDGYYRESHDIEGLVRELLGPFRSGAGRYRVVLFDEPADRPIESSAELVPDRVILIFDGLFLHRPELFGFWDFGVFLTADSRRERAWEQYLWSDLPPAHNERDLEIAARIAKARRRRYVDGQALYESEAKPRDRANLVIDNNDFLHPQVIATG